MKYFFLVNGDMSLRCLQFSFISVLSIHFENFSVKHIRQNVDMSEVRK